MRVVRYKLQNYKSLGSKGNCLLVDRAVTALVGKNESGKSNIIEAIGKTSLTALLPADYLACKNRGSSEDVNISAELEFTEQELSGYKIGQSKTFITYDGAKSINITGGLSTLIENRLSKEISEIVTTRNNKEVWNQAKLQNVNGCLDKLSHVGTRIFVNNRRSLVSLKGSINKTYENKDQLCSSIDKVIELLEQFYTLLPKIYYRAADLHFRQSYKYEDIKEIINKDNDVLGRLLKVADITEDEIEEAFKGTKDGDRQNARTKIRRKVEEKIVGPFNSFYNQERISVQVECEGTQLRIYVVTDEKVMNIRERSDGLRWYFSLFVDIFSYGYVDSPILFLLDEPGVHLHINAQKELLRLFEDLTMKNNQIIYTTHLPSMINSNNILNVRAVQKDASGNTRIFKSAYDQEISSYSKMETLSPIVAAIGADLKFQVGPSYANNIITEGISDYMYLMAMISFLGITNPPNIIPSAGVDNIHRIASILIGWGCDFKILLDFDKEGSIEHQRIIKKLDESLVDIIFFVNCRAVDRELMKQDPVKMESLVDRKDFDKLNTPFDGTDNTKTLAAREFFDRVKSKDIVPEVYTVNNFKKLFIRLGILSE